MAKTPVILSQESDTYNEKNVNGRFLINASGTWGTGTLDVTLNGTSVEAAPYMADTVKELVLVGDVSLVLTGQAGVTVVTVYLEKIK